MGRFNRTGGQDYVDGGGAQISVGEHSADLVEGLRGSYDIHEKNSEFSLSKSIKQRAKQNKFKSSLVLKRKTVRDDKNLMTNLNELISS